MLNEDDEDLINRFKKSEAIQESLIRMWQANQITIVNEDNNEIKNCSHTCMMNEDGEDQQSRWIKGPTSSRKQRNHQVSLLVAHGKKARNEWN